MSLVTDGISQTRSSESTCSVADGFDRDDPVPAEKPLLPRLNLMVWEAADRPLLANSHLIEQSLLRRIAALQKVDPHHLLEDQDDPQELFLEILSQLSHKFGETKPLRGKLPFEGKTVFVRVYHDDYPKNSIGVPGAIPQIERNCHVWYFPDPRHKPYDQLFSYRSSVPHCNDILAGLILGWLKTVWF